MGKIAQLAGVATLSFAAAAYGQNADNPNLELRPSLAEAEAEMFSNKSAADYHARDLGIFLLRSVIGRASIGGAMSLLQRK